MSLAAARIDTLRGYTLQRKIGSGSFGDVYLMDQALLGREVAVKVILPRYANTPDFVRSFEAEAQLVARLEHPFIVPLYDFWREPSGAYLVMRYLRGGTLRDLLDDSEAPLSPTVVADLLDQLASALHAAHRRGIVHRDIKPTNIMLDEERNVYLADFGIAKDLNNGSSLSLDTFAGSPAYTTPEQIKGEPVSSASDLYSLGLILYELLTQKHPFSHNNIAKLLESHLETPLPLIGDEPTPLDEVLQRATAKHPKDRYTSALALASAFRQALDQQTDRSTNKEPNPDIAATTSLINPYKGLQAFSEADADDFFGRDALVARLLMKLGDDRLEARFLAVVGPSGSGKSSVVQAGVLPKLRRGALPGSEQWFVVEMVPGGNPLSELEGALRRVATQPLGDLSTRLLESDEALHAVVGKVLSGQEGDLLLVIDQFEELFTQTDDEAVRRQFLANIHHALTSADSRLRVIITLRADFYDRPLLEPSFGALVQRRTEAVIPLSDQELQDAIVQPAERAGMRLEPGLVSVVIQDIRDEPSALPLLQYALTELFAQREGTTLTHRAYRRNGGVRGALARRAEAIYSDATATEQAAIRQLFLRLVTFGSETQLTRRRAFRAELVATSLPSGYHSDTDSDVMRQVLERYGGYRLLTFDVDPLNREPTVEIAHEALLHNWTRLSGWLEDNREALHIHRRLSLLTREWLGAERDPSFLARGAQLAQLEPWSDDHDLDLTPSDDERAYIRESIAAREARDAQAREQRQREQTLRSRSRWFLRGLVGVLAVATLISLSLLRTSRQAERTAANLATQAQSLALTNGAQLAMRDNDLDQALALALTALDIGGPIPQVERMLSEAAYAPGTERRFPFDAGPTWSVVAHPTRLEGFVATERDGVVRWDLETGAVFESLPHSTPVYTLALSPDGSTLASGDADGTVRLWQLSRQVLTNTPSASTPAPTSTERLLGRHDQAVRALIFSPDGRTLLSGGDDGAVHVWNVTNATRDVTLERHLAPVYALAYSPNARRAVSGDANGELIVWDTQSWQPIIQRPGHDGEIWALDISSDGLQLLSAAADRRVRVWRLEPLLRVHDFTGHTDQVYSVAFGPDGQSALSGSQDTSILWWTISSGDIRYRFDGHNGGVQSLTLDSGGRVLSASYDGTVRRWSLQSGIAEGQWRGHEERIRSVTFSADGSRALSTSDDTRLLLWDTATGRPIRRLEGHTSRVRDVAFSPDGRHALSAADDRTLIWWDLQTGDPVYALTGHREQVYSLALSPDGTRAISGSSDGDAILWDLEDGRELQRFSDHVGWVRGVAYSPRGDTVLTGTGEGRVVSVWDIETGAKLQTLRGHSDWLWEVAYSPDGSLAVSGASDNDVLVWDLRSGNLVTRLRGHSAPVYDVLFSADGNYVVSSAGDGTVRVWDIARGEEVRRFRERSAVWGIAISPNGETILSGGDEGVVNVWRLEPSLDALVAWTRNNRYVRPLTCDEQQRYNLPETSCS